MCMHPSTYEELKDLVDQLIHATDSNAYWLGQVRDTSLEIRELLISHEGEESPTVAAIRANWKCPMQECRFSSIKAMGHPCPL